jgi:ArsR family transcriptional regulator
MEQNLALFKALSDKTRLNIVALLLDGEKCVCEIYPHVKRTQSTVSIQLGKLEELGVVESRRQGKWIYYRIKDKRIYALVSALEGEDTWSMSASRRSSRTATARSPGAARAAHATARTITSASPKASGTPTMR